MSPRPQTGQSGNTAAISTLEFYRELFAPKPGPEALRPLRQGQPHLRIPGGLTVEEYCGKLVEAKAARERGADSGPVPPGLPQSCRRVQGGDGLLSWVLWVRDHGRVLAKQERAGETTTDFAYEYDPTGHLLRAWRNGRLAEKYAYDARGARIADWTPRHGPRRLAYDAKGRLVRAGELRYEYASDGTLRRVSGPDGETRCWYAPNLALARAVLPDGCELRYRSAPDGRLLAKYVDGRLAERYVWRNALQLAAWGMPGGWECRFLYRPGRRTPWAMEYGIPYLRERFLLGCDQVGSLKVVANPRGEVVKTLDYDSFGNLAADSQPGCFIPLGFAGGLADRHTGQVRFGRRDYAPSVGRFTAQDPLGDTGGDHDPYDYCVDDPVGRIDPEGLKDTAAPATGDGLLDGIGDFFSRMGENAGNWLTGTDDEAANVPTDSNKAAEVPKATASGKAAEADQEEPGDPPATAIEEFNTAGYETPATVSTRSTKRGPAINSEDEKLLTATPGVYVAPDGNLVVSKANVPPLPPGESYERNMQEMKGRVLEPGAWKEFKDKVQPGGEWDYKTKGSQFEPTGNFNYGAAAEAMGIPDAVADRAAGAAQQWYNPPTLHPGEKDQRPDLEMVWDVLRHQISNSTYGDNPGDQENIHLGQVYARQWKRAQASKTK